MTRSLPLRRCFVLLLCACMGVLNGFSYPIFPHTSAKTRLDGTITSSSSSNTICPGGSVTLTANSAPNGANFQWRKNGVDILGEKSVSYIATSAGSYEVVVTVDSVPETYPAVIITPAAVPVAGFTHTADHLCGSQPVGFTSTSTGTNLTYSWNFGDSMSNTNTSTDANPHHKFIGNPGNSTQNFTVKLTVTNDAGCSNTFGEVITMKQSPSTQLSGPSTTYNGESYFSACGNGPAVMTFGNVATQSSNTNYLIKWGDGSADFTSTSFNTINHTYAVGTYQLTFIVTGNSGCLDTANYKVFVGGNPAVGLGNPGNTSTCTGSSLTFPVTNTENNPPGTIYTVTFNDGSASKIYTSPPDTVTHYFNKSSCGTNSGSYPNSFSATIVASNPCSSSQAVVSPIYVSQKPQAQFTVSKSSTCVDNTLTFTNTSLGNEVSNGNCSVSKLVWHISPATGWTAATGDLGNDLSQSNASLWQSGHNSLPVRFTTPGTYTIELAVGSTNCGNDVITKTVCINLTPTADFTLDTQQGCGPLAVKATNASPAPGCGTDTYQWSVTPSTGVTYTNGTNANASNPQFNFANAGTYTVGLVVSRSNGECTSTKVNKTVSVTAKPIVTLHNAGGTICEGGTLTPTATVTASGTPTYAWTFEGGTPTAATAAVPGTITYTTPGVYTTTLAVTNDCGTTTSTQQITVNAKPVITQPADLVLCQGTSSGVVAFLGTAGATFSWVNNNTAIGLSASGSGNIASFIAQNTGTSPLVAHIMVTPVKGCSGTPVTFTITVNPLPSAATTGPDVRTCGITSYTLNGNTPTVGAGTWTQVAGPPVTFADIHNGSSDITGLSAGQRYQVNWTISNGLCQASAKTFTLDVLSPVINTIKANTLAICPGQQVQFSTDQLTGGDVPGTLTASYAYTWERSADGTTGWSAVSGGTAASLTVSPGVATFYRRRVSSYGLCTVTSNVVGITINAGAPTAQPGNPITLCNETQTILQATYPGAGFTGTWTDDAPGSTLVFSPDIHDPHATVSGLSAGQTYHLTWTVTSVACGSTSGGLVIRNLALLTNTLPAGPQVICSGQNVIITGPVPTGGNNIYTYTWESSTDGTTWSLLTGQQQSSLTVNPTQSTYYRRRVQSGTCSLVSTPTQVQVLPPISNNLIAAPQQLCSGQAAVNLTGSAPIGGDGTNYSFQWQQSADGLSWSNINGATLQDYDPGTPLQTLYLRRLASSAQCNGGQQNTSNIVKLTVNPPALAEFSASRVVGCVPFDLSSVISVVPHNDRNGAYTWYANGTVIGTGATFPGYILTNDGSSVAIRLLATSRYGCDTNSHTLVFQTTKSVDASFTKDQAGGCGPLTVNFTNTSVPLNGGQYHWDFGNGQTSSASQPGPMTFAANALGRDTTYIITLQAQTSCGLSVYRDSVKVRAKPQAIFTPDITIGCSPLKIHITNQSRGLPNSYVFTLGNGDQVLKSDNSAFDYTYTTTKTDTLVMKLVATNECGVDSASYNIVVYPNTVTANLIINGDNQSGCAPFAVQFDNHSTGANTFTYDFGDGSSASATISPQSVIHTFNQPGTYTVKLTASNGCSTASAMQVITVLAPPQTDFRIGQPLYCTNEEAIFVNATRNAANFSYHWDFGDGQSSTDENPRHVYTQAGSYTVRLTATQVTAGGASCGKTVTQNVTILEPPIPTFTSNAASGNCTPFTLRVQTTPGNLAAAAWEFGDAVSNDNTASGFSVSHTYTQPGLYTVKLRVYNNAGCMDSLMQVIRVTPSPKAAFTMTDSLICGNSAALHFTNTSTYVGTDPVNYQWLINDQVVSVQPQLSYSFSIPTGSLLPYRYRIKLLATNVAGGCTDSVVHIIQFNPLPVAHFSATIQTSCAPFEPKLTNSSTYADQFRWYLDGTLVSIEREPRLMLREAGRSYKLRLVAGNVYGCREDSFELTLSTYPKPQAMFTVTDSLSCNGRLTVNPVNKSTGATSYRWNFGDGSAELMGIASTHTYGQAGEFTLRLIASNGTCNDTLTREIRIAAPVKSAFAASVLSGCGSVSTVFQNLSVNGTSFLWDFGDGTYSSAKNPSHTFTYEHSPFTVKLIAYGEYGCADTAVLINYIQVTPAPVVDFRATPDSVITLPQYTFHFENNTTGEALRYSWDFGDRQQSTETQPTHTYKDTGTYVVQLTAVNGNGCSSFRKHNVRITGVPQYLYVPNAFEPGNSKSELQTFNVRADGLVSYQLRIFDKWGQLLFETHKLDEKGRPIEGWGGDMRGKPAPQGVYVWTISARFIDGSEWRGMSYHTNDKPSTTGIIHLIR